MPPGTKPRSGNLTGRHFTDAAPDGEKRVGDSVIHRVARYPPGEELPDRPVVPVIEIGEPKLIGVASRARGLPPDAHTQSTPSTPSPVTQNLLRGVTELVLPGRVRSGRYRAMVPPSAAEPWAVFWRGGSVAAGPINCADRRIGAHSSSLSRMPIRQFSARHWRCLPAQQP
jgi:hypothetical protein